MTEPLLYNYKAASERLGGVVSDSWLEHHKKELPRVEIGTKVGFCDEDLAEIIAMHRVRPAQQATEKTPSGKPAVLPAQRPGTPEALRDIKPRGASRKKTA